MIFFKRPVMRLFFITVLSLLIIMSTVVMADQNNNPIELKVSEPREAASAFTYHPLDRRDPFTPLIRREEPVAKLETTRRPESLRGPLERYELGQMRLIAVVVVSGDPRAMVSTPDGRSYTVKIDDYVGINGGRVRDIQTRKTGTDDQGVRIVEHPDRIIVEEVGIDSLSGKTVKEERFIVL